MHGTAIQPVYKVAWTTVIGPAQHRLMLGGAGVELESDDCDQCLLLAGSQEHLAARICKLAASANVANRKSQLQWVHMHSEVHAIAIA